MKTYFLPVIILASVMGIAVANELPKVQPPKELADNNSEFVEGTITHLSQEDIAQFIPFSQNAKSVLEKSLKDSEEMHVKDRVETLKRSIKSVVKGSGQKSYQMFMRFALNRTLLLVEEFEKYSDSKLPGFYEAELDLLASGIGLAISFYESDLSFQKRSSQGQDSINLPYADFGMKYGKTMLQSQMNVLNDRAQFRLLYKTLEMLNWDLSRDEHAKDMSDFIVQTYNTLSSINELPERNGSTNLKNIRTLSLIVQNLSNIGMGQVSVRSERQIFRSLSPSDVRNLLKPGGVVVVSGNSLFYLEPGADEERQKNCLSLNIPWNGGHASATSSAYSEGVAYKVNDEMNCRSVSRDEVYGESEYLSTPIKVTGSYHNKQFVIEGYSPDRLLVSCYEVYLRFKFSEDVNVEVNNTSDVINVFISTSIPLDAGNFCSNMFTTIRTMIYFGRLSR